MPIKLHPNLVKTLSKQYNMAVEEIEELIEYFDDIQAFESALKVLSEPKTTPEKLENRSTVDDFYHFEEINRSGECRFKIGLN